MSQESEKTAKRKTGVVDADEIISRGSGTTAKESDEDYAKNASETRCFLTSVLFLTRLPCPMWFPLVGAIVGLMSALWFDFMASVLPLSLAATASVAASVRLTGCFHEDGLGDTVDAFGGGWSLAQILRIMKDSRVGTYGSIALALFLIAKVHLLASLGPSEWRVGGGQGAGPALVAAHALARLSGPVLMRGCHYVIDEEDLKGGFYNWFARSKELLSVPRIVFSVVLASIIASLAIGVQQALVALAITMASSLIAGIYGNQVIGGVIGDFLGATVCMIELLIYSSICGKLPSSLAPAFRLGMAYLFLWCYKALVTRKTDDSKKA
ncbi:hypothetical protein GUITHDRAFT_100220 [Guillardia theta CCMP2712]|uniref:Adenosylcobinamide-GDP ribazoletransferase n=1 Tax=Guillardia theta (strain CCMP2712) TaxID=905079 RepID=L1K0J6_GUITC|nr:hypothetical protein GUITHDRAFT_100220 [Guillardia theta CCMP2712]EKX53970.1 hypothetical protein GUITHDRAFT_100220 [Guillardia theta CCMP2712]|eukprot:XP_005840950.1 hypothetical protein GUITHDRAFT_100220 [Guillardia theta CCMP2712]